MSSPEYLRAAAKSPGIRRIKAKAAELLALRPGHATLDIGCGPGIDTIARARLVGSQGRVLGVDSSAAMVAEANRQAQAEGVSGWTNHQVASSSALPFADASFNSCASERLFQHLTPTVADWTLTEAIRVTKPGGTIVIVDTDWSTFSVDADPDLARVERRLHAVHLQRFANPFSGRQLFRMFRHKGLLDASIDLFGISLEHPTVDLLLYNTGLAALTLGVITPTDLKQWRQSLAERAAHGTFFAHVGIVAVSGFKPPDVKAPATV